VKTIQKIDRKIRTFVQKKQGLKYAILGTVITEFSPILKIALVTRLGLMERFSLFKANPTQLKEEEKQLRPLLLISGNYCHQGTFLPLLHLLHCNDNKRPIFTLNLAPNKVEASAVLAKVEEIKSLYTKTDENDFTIDMVGHSMGSNVIQLFYSSPPKTFAMGRVVTIGTPIYPFHISSFKEEIPTVKKPLGSWLMQPFSFLFPWIFKFEEQSPNKIEASSSISIENTFDVIGTSDLLIPRKSCLPLQRTKEIHTGHFGLLSHPESLQAIHTFLET